MPVPLFSFDTATERRDARLTFPYIAVRRSGVSPKGCERLTFAQTSAAIDTALTLERACRADAPELCAFLERAIAGREVPAARRALLRLRRDIYNDRSPSPSTVSSARAALAEGLSAFDLARFDEWVAARQRREDLRHEMVRAFAEELRAARVALKRLVRNREFRKGVALASPTLSDERRAYVIAPPADEGARVSRVERALLRYYSRCAFKLSPFSTFTRTALLQVADPGEGAGERPAFGAGRITRCVRINRTIVGTLARRVAREPELRGHALVWRAASSEHSDKLTVLRRRYGETGVWVMNLPREATVELPDGRAVRWISNYLRERGGAATFERVTTALSRHTGGPARAVECVERLVDLGVLVHKIPLNGGDDTGLDALIAFLDDTSSPLAAQLAEQLRHLARTVEQIAGADADRRCALLREVHGGVARAFVLLGLPTDEWVAPLVYEDCLEEPVGAVQRPSSGIPFGDLAALWAIFGHLTDVNLSVRHAIGEMLLRDFAGGPVPLLRFVDHCQTSPTQHQGHLYRPYFHTPNVLDLDRVNALASLRMEMGRVLSATSDAEEIDLALLCRQHRWPERLGELGFDASYARALCISCYGQPYRKANGAAGFVVNGIAEGPARALVRACAGLAGATTRARVAEDIGRCLERLYPGTEPCEVAAHHDYNANLHPRVTRRIIDYDEEAGPRNGALSLEALSLEVTGDGRVACYDTTTGHEVTPLTLGTMADSFAPPVQRLLSSLGHVWLVSSKPFHADSWSLDDQEQALEHYPRLVFGDCVVRRRGWAIRRDALPLRTPRESDLEYFWRVRRWRLECGLPEEVFSRARAYAESMHDAKSGRRRWISHKPQYVDFRSYLFVDILERLMTDVKRRLYVEEMLPGRADWGAMGLPRPIEVVVDVCLQHEAEAARRSKHD
jgi:hypothetical protein